MIKTAQELKKFKRKMLRNINYYEKIIMLKLKEKYKEKEDFKRQVIIGTFIVDFILLPKMLIIESDGLIHENQKNYDTFRDKLLKKWGFTVLRIKTENVKNVLKLIETYPDIENYVKLFRSGLGKANAYRSKVIQKQKLN